MYALIVAGGSGSRLWPLSKKRSPKQLIKLLHNQTLLRTTYDRVSSFIPPEHTYIATTKQLSKEIARELPEVPKANFSIETDMKNRAPAIGLAALLLYKHNPDSVFFTAWSDHEIPEQKKFEQLIRRAEKFILQHPSSTLLIGVTPKEPHTGYGYIKKGKAAEKSVFEVRSFIEKPTEKIAQKLIASDSYLWNTGMFAWKTATLLHLYQVHLPDVYQTLMKIQPFIGTRKQSWAIDEYYPLMPSVELEDGIIEKLKKDVYVLESDIQWHDVGSWDVIKKLSKTGTDNITQGKVVTLNSKNVFIHNTSEDMLVTSLGIEDLVIVLHENNLLISHVRHAKDLKHLLKKVVESGFENHL